MSKLFQNYTTNKPKKQTIFILANVLNIKATLYNKFIPKKDDIGEYL
jgi:hypothetical protein